ncbi:MAG: DUF3656 domain-containing protein [Oscillospiraceae bacterium]|nr:DUF3656 domain-containing protein [Oscillospiraceae bacterium]
MSLKLNKDITYINSKENMKRDVNCTLKLKKGTQAKVVFEDVDTKTAIEYLSAVCENLSGSTDSAGTELKLERISQQISKTGNTIFNVSSIKIDMDEDVFVPISSVNEIRREGLIKLEEKIANEFKRDSKESKFGAEALGSCDSKIGEKSKIEGRKQGISLLLSRLDKNKDYALIKGIDDIYIPFRYFIDDEYEGTVTNICDNFRAYIYLPAITKSAYEKLIREHIGEVLRTKKIEGIVVSNMSIIELLRKMEDEKTIKSKDLKLVANYTMNVFNNNSVVELEKMGVERYTVSPELDKDSINSISGNSAKEAIIYGRALLMTSEYCIIGNPKNCSKACEKGKYILKDRMGFQFPIYTDSNSCTMFIYNSKITSIDCEDLDVDWVRIDILDESISEINDIIQKHKNYERMEGKDYTSGNINRIV